MTDALTKVEVAAAQRAAATQALKAAALAAREAGETGEAVARAAGVTRATLYAWAGELKPHHIATTIDAALRQLQQVVSPYLGGKIQAGLDSTDMQAKIRRLHLGLKSITAEELDQINREKIRLGQLAATTWTNQHRQGHDIEYFNDPTRVK